jgi:GTP1/Obg family GTP-binding protein
MASHHQLVTIRPRSLANVLSDLKEARGDLDDAQCAIRVLARIGGEQCDEIAATEAETRLEDLREEFDARFVSVAGLTVEQVMKAREGALI